LNKNETCKARSKQPLELHDTLLSIYGVLHSLIDFSCFLF